MVLVRKINRKSMKIIQKCELVKKKISARKNTFSKKRIFLVAAGGLFYLDLNFECNRRRSDLSQRNIGTSRNWSKMSPECSNLNGSNHMASFFLDRTVRVVGPKMPNPLACRPVNVLFGGLNVDFGLNLVMTVRKESQPTLRGRLRAIYKKIAIYDR